MPSRETVWFVPLLVITLLVAMSLTIFLSPAIGVPLLIIAAIFGAVAWFGNNSSSTGRMNVFREQAPTDRGVEFSARDQETLTKQPLQRGLIGCSGWSYKDWKGLFYPAKGCPTNRWLEFYAQHFPSV